MIIEINKENVDKIVENEILKKEDIEKELSVNPFGNYLVLIENEQIIGYIYYSDIYERAEINQFEIKVSHRNCGKGTKLLKKMIELVDKDITLEVRENNMSAIKVYESNGFVKKAIRKNYYDGTDGILMERVK